MVTPEALKIFWNIMIEILYILLSLIFLNIFQLSIYCLCLIYICKRDLFIISNYGNDISFSANTHFVKIRKVSCQLVAGISLAWKIQEFAEFQCHYSKSVKNVPFRLKICLPSLNRWTKDAVLLYSLLSPWLVSRWIEKKLKGEEFLIVKNTDFFTAYFKTEKSMGR